MDSIGNEYWFQTDLCGTFRIYSYKMVGIHTWLNAAKGLFKYKDDILLVLEIAFGR